MIENEIENNEIVSLIRKDHVTCAHYNRNRIFFLLHLICHDNKYMEIFNITFLWLIFKIEEEDMTMDYYG